MEQTPPSHHPHTPPPQPPSTGPIQGAELTAQTLAHATSRADKFEPKLYSDSSMLNSSAEGGFHHSIDFSLRNSNPLHFAALRKTTEIKAESPSKASEPAPYSSSPEPPSTLKRPLSLPDETPLQYPSHRTEPDDTRNFISPEPISTPLKDMDSHPATSPVPIQRS